MNDWMDGWNVCVVDPTSTTTTPFKDQHAYSIRNVCIFVNTVKQMEIDM